MRHYDKDEAERLQPEPWMVELLELNPRYVSWGPHEDYMIAKGSGWNVPVVAKSWTEFGPSWELDELNEVVNFYFSVERPAKDCEVCGGNGTHPDSQWISESFYEHSSPFRSAEQDQRYQATKRYMEQAFGCNFNQAVIARGSLPSSELLARYGQPFAECCVRIMEHGGYWSDDITEDEAAALVEDGRGYDGRVTAADFNRSEAKGGIGVHDAINRWILVERRLKRLGLPERCGTCEGHGNLFTGPARVDLTLWFLHPRKGCSRGVEVQSIQRSELAEAYAFLATAARRNAERFAAITRLVPELSVGRP